jgi:L-threonylcarbamoyladenylate synthase
MPNPSPIEQAVAALRRGGIVAYPTEAVYGLGCDPFNADALERVFAAKRRPSARGVLLVAADYAQIEPLIDRRTASAASIERALATWPGPHTWIFPRSDAVPEWIARGHAGVALRVTAHPLAAELCRAFGGPIVSTSANRHGDEPARNADAVRAAFGSDIDVILDGAVGGLDRPTPIRDAMTGDSLRQ